MLKLAAMLLLSVLLIGCSSVIDENAKGTLDELFGLPYQVLSTRQKDGQWSAPNGGLYLLLTGEDVESGTLTRVWSEFGDNPCPVGQVCNCTGKVAQTFTVANPVEAKAPADVPYSIFDGTEAPSPVNADSSGDPLPEIYRYDLQLKMSTISVSEYCRAEPDRIITIYRFQNGDLILEDGTYQVALRRR